jgi:hypothetical protein
MLAAKQSFKNDLFAAKVLLSIVEERVQSCRKMKTSGIFLHPDNAGLHRTLDRHNRRGIKKLSHLPTVQI